VKAIGIDLAGLATNPSGFAILEERKFKTQVVHTDEQITYLCIINNPDIVAIDAPLSLPRRGSLRKADFSLIKRGLRVFPPRFGGMLLLTARGIRLAEKLRSNKIKVIEVHPRTSGLLLFKTGDRKQWLAQLRRDGFSFKGAESRHEIDAVMAAVTGLLYLKNKVEEVGAQDEGTIIIPKG